MPPAVFDIGFEDTQLAHVSEDNTDMYVVQIFEMFRDFARGKHLYETPALSGNRTSSDIAAMDIDSRREIWRKENTRRMSYLENVRRMMHTPFTPWWSRIWVVQEVKVAPQVVIVYGTISAPWELLSLGLWHCMRHGRSCCARFLNGLSKDERKVLDDCCHRMLAIDELRNGRTSVGADYPNSFGFLTTSPYVNSRPLLDLLHMFRDREASDARDKVYALLGIAKISPWVDPMVPNYSLTEVEVFSRATIQCIYEVRSLSVFSTDLGRKFRNDLPSWVPEWGAPGGPTYEARLAAVNLYNACPWQDGSINEVVRPGQGLSMKAVGLKIGTIDHVEKVMWGGDQRSVWRDTLMEWLYTWNKHKYHPYRKPAFWRLICADVLCNDRPRRICSQDEISFLLWAQISPSSPISFVELGTDREKVWALGKLLLNLQVLGPNTVEDTNIIDDETLLGYLLDFADDESLLFSSFSHPVPASQLGPSLGALVKAPWRRLINQVTSRFLGGYDQIGNLGLGYYEHPLPVIEESVMAGTLSRRFIACGPHVGMGPAQAKVGDELYILKGGKTPFVLRASNVQASTQVLNYEIIGDCYVQDLMGDGKNTEVVVDDNAWKQLSLI